MEETLIEIDSDLIADAIFWLAASYCELDVLEDEQYSDMLDRMDETIKALKAVASQNELPW